MLRHKYHAVSCERDEKRFGSKAERRQYDRLKLLQKEGSVVFFIRQVPFELPGETTYRADFMVFMSDGTVRIQDVKGFSTPVFELKKRLLEETYPIELEIIK